MLYNFIYKLIEKRIYNNKSESSLLIKDDEKEISIIKINETLNRFSLQYLWSKNKIYLYCYKVLSDYQLSYSKYNILELKDFIYKENLEHLDEDLVENNIKIETRKLYETLVYFKNKEFMVELDKGRVSKELINNVFLHIEELIKKHGFYFVKVLLEELNVYKKEYDMYYLTIKNEYYSEDSIYPYGLLLMLGLKHYNNFSSEFIYLERDYEFIMELSSHLVNLLNIHFYGQNFELIFSNGENFIQETQRLVLLDSIFRFNQYNPNHVLWLIEKTVEKINVENFDSDTKRKIKIIYEIFEFTYKNNIHHLELSEFIIKFNKYNKNEIISMLIEISHINCCNNNYKKLYDDLDKLDYYNKAFIINYREKYNTIIVSIPDHSIFCIGFYNCIMKLLRKEDKNIDSKMGKWMEHILAEKLRKIGLSVIGPDKKYKLTKEQKNTLNLKSNDLETDLIIEFNDRIAFIEIKKKTLRKESKSGKYLSILEDLGKSLITSQMQTYRHERFLKKYKEINFSDNTKLELMNRDVITISLSIFNYGLLHDFSFTSKMLDLLSRGMLVDKSYEKQEEIDEFNKILKKLHDEVSLKSYEYRHMKFNKCHFLNFFHLLYLVDLCKRENLEPSYIFKKVMDNKRITTNIFDFYYEFSFLLSLDHDLYKYVIKSE